MEELNKNQNLIDINDINKHVSLPITVFSNEFTKEELRKVKHDLNYYIKNKRYIENIEYFKTSTLPEKIKYEDEKREDYLEKKRKYN